MSNPRFSTPADKPGTRAFVGVDAAGLAARIESARERVVFVAPALWPPVADALTSALRRLGPERVQAVVDPDPDVFRLGYGSFAAVDALERAFAAAGGMLLRQDGTRIGLLICDDTTCVYAPQPGLVAHPAEADERQATQPDSHAQPNGLELGAPPPAVLDECGASAPAKRRIGQDKAERARLQAVAEDLRNRPPMPFDLSRQVRVYNGHVLFALTKCPGTRPTQRAVRLPAELLGLFDDTTRDRLEGRLRLFDKAETLEVFDRLQTARTELEDRFLKRVPGYGNLLAVGDKAAFLSAVQAFNDRLAKAVQEVRSPLLDRIEAVRDDLEARLTPSLMGSTPPDWLRQHDAYDGTAQRARLILQRRLDRVFYDALRTGKVGPYAVQFHAVTYEMLRDPAFVRAARHAFPELHALHDETQAAEARPPAAPAPTPCP